MNKNIAIVAIFHLALTGCAVVHSQKLNLSEGSTQGVVYYLPTKPIKFEFDRALAPTKQDITKATANVASAKDALDTAEAARKEAERIFKNTSPGTVGRIDAEKDLQLKTAVKNNREEDLKTAEKTLIAKVTENANSDGKTELTDKITITALANVADTYHRYTAKLNHLVTRSDQLTLKTNAAGLLNSSTAKSEDKTADILVMLAQSIAAQRANTQFETKLSQSYTSEVKIPTILMNKEIKCGGRFTRAKTLEQKPFKFELVFDPTQTKYSESKPKVSGQLPLDETDMSPWEYISASLCANGADYAFGWEALGEALNVSVPATKNTVIDDSNGLFYRRLLPYRLTIYTGTRSDQGFELHTSVKAMQFDLPNGSPAELLKLEAGGFVTTDMLTEFQDGVLLSHKEERPSEALAIVKIPYDIVKALISIPAEILSLKVNYSTKEAALIDAKATILKSQKALDDSEKINQK